MLPSWWVTVYGAARCAACRHLGRPSALRWLCGFYIDAKGVNHGFWLNAGVLTKLDFPGSTFTQALGLNNKNEMVGRLHGRTGITHGFVYNTSTKTWMSVDDPNGIGTTVVNGTNDKHELVGFWGTNPTNTGFVATLP